MGGEKTLRALAFHAEMLSFWSHESSARGESGRGGGRRGLHTPPSQCRAGEREGEAAEAEK